ncbi:MAG: HEAT repeat domain-containing protein [Deltaproteobacteria bacterium]|nr:HEAT repeat domain-containing protein [Deltaproteobacteria bacterium]
MFSRLALCSALVLFVPFFQACNTPTDPKTPEYWIDRLDDDKEREDAIRKLGELKDKKGVEPLLKILKENEKARPLAAQSLGSIGDPAATSALIGVIDLEAGSGTDEATRLKQRTNERAVGALAELKAKDASDIIAKLYAKTRDQNVRLATVRAMGAIQDKKFVPMLADVIEQDDNMFMKRVAAEALGELGDPAGVPALILGMYIEKGASIYPQASFSIFQIGKDAIPALIETLDGKNAKVKKLAEDKGFIEGAVEVKIIEVLGDLKAKQAEDRLLRLFDSVKNPMSAALVRRGVALALAQIGTPRAVPLLMKNASEPASDLRQFFVDALNELSDRAALPALLASAKAGEDVEGKKAAFVAYTRLGDGRELANATALTKGKDDVSQAFAKELVRLTVAKECGENADCWIGKLKDKEPKVRDRAAYALGRLGDKKAAEPLAAALKDDNLDARYAMIWALNRVGTKAQVPALEKIYAAEKGTLYYIRVNEYLKRLIVSLKRA